MQRVSKFFCRFSPSAIYAILYARLRFSILMKCAIFGVNAGYLARLKLLEDPLRNQQQAISRARFAAFGPSLTDV
ncbi:hypothetical protein D6B98_30310 [Bradyrhizobium sp. LVM 105]|nr:hypothetical protein D6B98_30310 [Bradyrhizobium sp. LVM 105]